METQRKGAEERSKTGFLKILSLRMMNKALFMRWRKNVSEIREGTNDKIWNTSQVNG